MWTVSSIARGKNTCSSDLNFNISYNRLLFLGGIFICNRPTRNFTRISEHFSCGQFIYLNYRTVYISIKYRLPLSSPISNILSHMPFLDEYDFFIKNSFKSLFFSKIQGLQYVLKFLYLVFAEY